MRFLFFVISLVLVPYIYGLNPDDVFSRYAKHGPNADNKIKQFQEDFRKALEKPEQMGWIGQVYTDGLMNHIAYSELPPSFLAYVDLHQSLYRYMKDIDRQDPLIPSLIVQDFFDSFKEFKTQLDALNAFSNIEYYENRLHALYKAFLIDFMNRYANFFEKKWRESLDQFYRFRGHEMDTIDRAFFSLKRGWPGYEKNDQKYQFELLYAYRCNNGAFLILGYNDRPYVCDRLLHIYVVNKKEPLTITKVELQGASFDLSPQPRMGGCGFKANLQESIRFDGRFLSFKGYDYAQYKKYVYDVESNVCCVESSSVAMTK